LKDLLKLEIKLLKQNIPARELEAEVFGSSKSASLSLSPAVSNSVESGKEQSNLDWN